MVMESHLGGAPMQINREKWSAGCVVYEDSVGGMPFRSRTCTVTSDKVRSLIRMELFGVYMPMTGPTPRPPAKKSSYYGVSVHPFYYVAGDNET